MRKPAVNQERLRHDFSNIIASIFSLAEFHAGDTDLPAPTREAFETLQAQALKAQSVFAAYCKADVKKPTRRK